MISLHTKKESLVTRIVSKVFGFTTTELLKIGGPADVESYASLWCRVWVVLYVVLPFSLLLLAYAWVTG